MPTVRRRLRGEILRAVSGRVRLGQVLCQVISPCVQWENRGSGPDFAYAGPRILGEMSHDHDPVRSWKRLAFVLSEANAWLSR